MRIPRRVDEAADLSISVGVAMLARVEHESQRARMAAMYVERAAEVLGVGKRSDRPRVYLCGAMEALPDLGSGWRAEVADELEALGVRPMWPPGSFRGMTEDDVAGAREYYASHRWSVIAGCFETMSRCQGILVRWCAKIGHGTRLEVDVARNWANCPVIGWAEVGGSYVPEGGTVFTDRGAAVRRIADDLGVGRPAPGSECGNA